MKTRMKRWLSNPYLTGGAAVLLVILIVVNVALASQPKTTATDTDTPTADVPAADPLPIPTVTPEMPTPAPLPPLSATTCANTESPADGSFSSIVTSASQALQAYDAQRTAPQTRTAIDAAWASVSRLQAEYSTELTNDSDFVTLAAILSDASSALDASDFGQVDTTEIPSIVPALLAQCSAVPVTSANPDQQHKITYSVTGNGSSATITWGDIGGTQQGTGVAIPWTSSTGDVATDSLALTAQATDGDTISCTITRDGAVISRNTSTGQYTVVTCSASF